MLEIQTGGSCASENPVERGGFKNDPIHRGGGGCGFFLE